MSESTITMPPESTRPDVQFHVAGAGFYDNGLKEARERFEQAYFEAQGNAVRIETPEQFRKTVRELADELDPQRFVQIHRSAIVNLRCVSQVTRGPVRRDHRRRCRLRKALNLASALRRRS